MERKRNLILKIALAAALAFSSTQGVFAQESTAAKVKCVPHLPSSGDVLVTGGEDGNFNESAQTEFFHVSSQQWLTGCPTKVAHDEAEMMLWSSAKGAKLIELAGESSQKTKLDDHTIVKNAEVYDPVSGLFKKGPSVPIGLEDFAATALLDGSIMVVGGVTGSDIEAPVQTAAILGASSWKKVKAKMTIPRAAPCAATIAAGESKGKVLIVGGTDTSEDTPMLATAEIYDPTAKTFTLTSQSLSVARSYAVCTALPDGKVLVTGGIDNSGNGISTAEIYDPATDSFTVTAGSMNVGRVDHTATLLPDGTVLVAGGETSYTGSSISLNSAEIYDPSTGKFTLTVNMNDLRDDSTATLIAHSGTSLDGQVLIAGGFTGVGVTVTAELYDPVAKTFTLTSNMNFAHGLANAGLIP